MASGQSRCNRQPTRRAAAAALAFLASSAWLVPSSSATDPASVRVLPGSLAVIPWEPTAVVATLDGPARQVITSWASFSVVDARGTGLGWTLTIEASALREIDADGYVPGGQELPVGSLGLAGLTIASDDPSAALPEVRAGPYSLDGSSVIVARAAAGTGMGSFTFSPTALLPIAVPAGARSGSFRSEVAITAVSGP